MSIYLGDFDLSETCTEEECESSAVSIIALYDTDEPYMTVRCLCLPHAIHHKSQFADQDKN